MPEKHRERGVELGNEFLEHSLLILFALYAHFKMHLRLILIPESF